DEEAEDFIRRVEGWGPGMEAAAAFRFQLDDFGWRARALERMVALRCAVLKLPYGDQGLLIRRSHYDRIGGYRPMPLMEDVDIIRRIGRARLILLRAPARTSAARYRREGYASRVLRNMTCLTLYAAGVSPERLVKYYG
ncbi:MAG: glycosyl transferase family 2, partial [Pseudomonadota bacterium]